MATTLEITSTVIFSLGYIDDGPVSASVIVRSVVRAKSRNSAAVVGEAVDWPPSMTCKKGLSIPDAGIADR
jgi:hypothetical protein